MKTHTGRFFTGRHFSLAKYQKQLVVCAVTCLLSYEISANWFQIMLIQGESMYPSYHAYQIVILDKRYRDFQRGDVIAFTCEGFPALLVKRIAAVPNDTVEIAGGRLYVNDKPDGNASGRGRIKDAGIAQNPVKLSENEYFVMGDNYEKSKDSRDKKIGCVKRSSIVGRVWPHCG